MLEKQLWEPAGLTQRVPAADNCTEIAIAANKVIAEIKVNLRNFMLPPRCACLQSNGAGSVKPLGRREARGAAEAQVYAQSGFCQGFSPDCDSHTPFATNDNAARCLGRPSFCGHCGKGGSTITAVNRRLHSEPLDEPPSRAGRPKGIPFRRVKSEETERSESAGSRLARSHPFTQLSQSCSGLAGDTHG